MSKTSRPKLKSRATLEREIIELKAQLAYTYHAASHQLKKFPDLTASGALVTITALGGREIVTPVVIRGGLSPETIRALMLDIKRSYDEAVEFKPHTPALS